MKVLSFNCFLHNCILDPTYKGLLVCLFVFFKVNEKNRMGDMFVFFLYHLWFA